MSVFLEVVLVFCKILNFDFELFLNLFRQQSSKILSPVFEDALDCQRSPQFLFFWGCLLYQFQVGRHFNAYLFQPSALFFKYILLS